MPYSKYYQYLKEVISILNKVEIPYWLDGGTLLGAIREGKIIDGDNDSDLGIFESDLTIEKLEKLTTELKKNKFEIVRESKNYVITLKKDNIQVELWRFAKNGNYFYHQGWDGEFIFPKKLLEKFKTVKFNNFEVSIPNSEKEYLVNLYGKDWTIKKEFKKPYDYPAYVPASHASFFFRVLSLLDENKIDYMAIAGTLLGALREKNFLASDHRDTDIALDDKDYWKVRKILDTAAENGLLAYYYIWRKEICVIDLKNTWKVDLFFLEKDNDKYYIYSYEPNKENGNWDKEWRASFSYEYFYPLKKISFLGKEIKIPNQPEKILEEHYGNWRIPDNKFNSLKVDIRDSLYNGFSGAGVEPNKEFIIDKNTYDVAYILVNFLRPQQTKECIESIKKYLPNVKIYVADQDEPTSEMLKFYEKNNIEYYFVPKDSVLSYCRNLLIDKSIEPYILWGDNDFLFNEHNNVDKAINILKKRVELGCLGGFVCKNGATPSQCHYERILSYEPKYQLLLLTPLEHTKVIPQIVDGEEFYYCDLTYNYVLAKRDLFTSKEIRWNPKIKVNFEHIDIFMRIKYFTEYRVGYYPQMVVLHNHLEPHEYMPYRKRQLDGPEFGRSWNLERNMTVGIGGAELYDSNHTILPIEVLKKQDYNELYKMNLSYLSKFHQDLAIGIPVFLRQQGLKKLVNSIKEFYPNIKVYVAHQGKVEKDAELYYNELKKNGYEVIKLPFDCGVSKAKIELAKRIKEPYIAFFEDDLLVTKHTNILTPLKFLKENPNVAVAGWSEKGAHYEWLIQKEGDILKLYSLQKNITNGISPKQHYNGLPFYYCDIIQNFGIWRKDVVERMYDENIKVIEHTDSFYTLKEKLGYKVVYFPDFEMEHHPDRSNQEYNLLRGRKDDLEYIFRKIGIKDIQRFDEELPTTKEEIINIKSIEKKSNVSPINPKFTIVDFLKKCKELNIKVCLLDQTCLQAVRYDSILNQTSFILGVSQEFFSNLPYFLDLGFVYNGNILQFNNFIIKIEKFPLKTKFITVDAIEVEVPFPVVQYLVSKFGPNWKEIKDV